MELSADFNEVLFKDYARFHEVQIANRDVDPVYPVLRELASVLGWSDEERVRAVFLHVAYYDLGSALAAFEGSGSGKKLAIGTERRRHRMGDNLADHIADLSNIANLNGGLLAWMQRYDSWDAATEALMSVNGNGRWAAYKTCEMLAEVCGLPLAASDMGHAGSTGPRKGLALLYPGASATGTRPAVINALNGYSTQLVKALQARGLEARMETAETTLCDFHSMVHGRYYPGLDIDVMQEQLNKAPLSNAMLDAVYSARNRTLPYAYLGEQQGWQQPDRERKSFYKRTGQIITRGDS